MAVVATALVPKVSPHLEAIIMVDLHVHRIANLGRSFVRRKVAEVTNSVGLRAVVAEDEADNEDMMWEDVDNKSSEHNRMKFL